jgi:hypothetical protein
VVLALNSKVIGPLAVRLDHGLVDLRVDALARTAPLGGSSRLPERVRPIRSFSGP